MRAKTDKTARLLDAVDRGARIRSFLDDQAVQEFLTSEEKRAIDDIESAALGGADVELRAAALNLAAVRRLGYHLNNIAGNGERAEKALLKDTGKHDA